MNFLRFKRIIIYKNGYWWDTCYQILFWFHCFAVFKVLYPTEIISTVLYMLEYQSTLSTNQPLQVSYISTFFLSETYWQKGLITSHLHTKLYPFTSKLMTCILVSWNSHVGVNLLISLVRIDMKMSCTRGMIHNKIHLISLGCPWPSIALLQNHGPKRWSFIHWYKNVDLHLRISN